MKGFCCVEHPPKLWSAYFGKPLTDCELSGLALKLEDVIRERAKRNQEATQLIGKAKQKDMVYQTLGTPIHTNKELGKIAGVSDETIRKYKKIGYCIPELESNAISQKRLAAYFPAKLLKSLSSQIEIMLCHMWQKLNKVSLSSYGQECPSLRLTERIVLPGQKMTGVSREWTAYVQYRPISQKRLTAFDQNCTKVLSRGFTWSGSHLNYQNGTGAIARSGNGFSTSDEFMADR